MSPKCSVRELTTRKNSQGVLIVNVGYDTTEVSILSLGGIVLSRLIKVGGQKLSVGISRSTGRPVTISLP